MPAAAPDHLVVISLDGATLAAVDALALKLNRASREAVLAYLVTQGIEAAEHRLQAAAASDSQPCGRS